MAKGKITKSSPNKVWAQVALMAGSMIYQGIKSSNEKKKEEGKLAIAQRKRDAMMAKYKNQKFEYTNPYEDTTVNLQAAKLQQQGLAQNQADILEGLRSGTSGAGAAALATGLSRQASKAQRQISADIGRQESDINIKKAEAEAAGQLAKQQFEIDRMQTMLGMSMEEVGAVRAGELQQQQNQAATTGAVISAVGNVAGEYAGTLGTNTNTGTTNVTNVNNPTSLATQPNWAYVPVTPEFGPPGGGTEINVDPGGGTNWSDRKLKKNISKIGKSPSGLNIYSFEYKDSKYGEGIFQGVMSDEMPSYAVINNDGYDMVDYSLIDVDFKIR